MSFRILYMIRYVSSQIWQSWKRYTPPLLHSGQGGKLNNVFTRVAGGRAPTHSENPVEGVVIMSTYEELSLIISIALLVVAILNYTHKK